MNKRRNKTADTPIAFRTEILDNKRLLIVDDVSVMPHRTEHLLQGITLEYSSIVVSKMEC
jgi:hypothetical protein